MMWVLVILTVAGGSSWTQSSLAQCQQNLRTVITSPVRDAFCMSTGSNDRIYFIKDGKQLVVAP